MTGRPGWRRGPRPVRLVLAAAVTVLLGLAAVSSVVVVPATN